MSSERYCKLAKGCPAFNKLETNNFHQVAALKLIREKIKINSFTANETVTLINGVLRDE